MQKIAILLSTYNGELFLKEQLDSLLHQKNIDDRYTITIVIRDDGSSDSTREIINEYVFKNKEKLNFFYDGDNLGPRDSFLRLINLVSADIYFFCDQDDVWLPSKVSRAIKAYENKGSKPFLYYSALAMTDKTGKILKKINTHNYPENLLSSLNETLATGATIMFNDKLAQLYRNKDSKINKQMLIMHDSYLYIMATLFGELYFDDEATILYRQHEKNVVGASGKGIIKKISKLRSMFLTMYSEGRYKRQAKEILRVYSLQLSDEQIHVFRLLCEKKVSFKRQLYLLRNLRLKSVFMNACMKLYIILRIY